MTCTACRRATGLGRATPVLPISAVSFFSVAFCSCVCCGVLLSAVVPILGAQPSRGWSPSRRPLTARWPGRATLLDWRPSDGLSEPTARVGTATRSTGCVLGSQQLSGDGAQGWCVAKRIIGSKGREAGLRQAHVSRVKLLSRSPSWTFSCSVQSSGPGLAERKASASIGCDLSTNASQAVVLCRLGRSTCRRLPQGTTK